jgi:hypothetical protein
MPKLGYAEFRKHFDQIFDGVDRTHTVAHQLVDLTDLFQKVSAVYAYAQTHSDTSFHNPIIFQIVESALYYGVCIPVRRLADGSQRNEVSLFRLVAEIRSNCRSWTREQFVTWDGAPYDPSALQAEHRLAENRIIKEHMDRGEHGFWLPIGKHAEIFRRHSLFDLLSGTQTIEVRSKEDHWTEDAARYLSEVLKEGSKDVVHFANTYLAHRVLFPPDRQPQYKTPLSVVERAVIALWRCFNVLNSMFRDSYMTPDIAHSLSSFNNLHLALVSKGTERSMLDAYELVKKRMSTETNDYSNNWQSEFRKRLS